MLFLLMNLTKCCTVSSPKKDYKHSLFFTTLESLLHISCSCQIVDLALNWTNHMVPMILSSPPNKKDRITKRKWKNGDTFNVEWVGMIYIHIRIEFCFVCNHALTLPNHEALNSLLVLLESSHQGSVHVCCFTIFEPMDQKLLNVKWKLSLKIN
jgi:hypothetical protein